MVTDDEGDEEAAYEAWRLRELERIRAHRAARDAAAAEAAEKERCVGRMRNESSLIHGLIVPICLRLRNMTAGARAVGARPGFERRSSQSICIFLTRKLCWFMLHRRLRNMTAGEREEWERAQAAKAPSQKESDKKSWKFMQKYWHKGAFFQQVNLQSGFVAALNMAAACFPACLAMSRSVCC